MDLKERQMSQSRKEALKKYCKEMEAQKEFLGEAAERCEKKFNILTRAYHSSHYIQYNIYDGIVQMRICYNSKPYAHEAQEKWMVACFVASKAIYQYANEPEEVYEKGLQQIQKMLEELNNDWRKFTTNER